MYTCTQYNRLGLLRPEKNNPVHDYPTPTKKIYLERIVPPKYSGKVCLEIRGEQFCDLEFYVLLCWSSNLRHDFPSFIKKIKLDLKISDH